MSRQGLKQNIIFKRRNKERLHVALYRGPDPDPVYPGGEPGPESVDPAAGPDERKYTWCFIVGPKHETQFYAVPGLRLVVERDPWSGRWIMSRHFEVNIKNAGPRMLCRVLVGKIVDKQRMWNVLYGVAVGDEQSGTYRNSAWLAEALAALRDSPRGEVMAPCSRLEWTEVRDAVLGLADKLEGEGRFEGMLQQDINLAKPAWDLIEDRYIWP